MFLFLLPSNMQQLMYCYVNKIVSDFSLLNTLLDSIIRRKKKGFDEFKYK